MKSRVSGTHTKPSSRRALSVFIPTNSDGQKLENLKKKRREKFLKNNSLSAPNVSASLKFALHPFIFYFYFL